MKVLFIKQYLDRSELDLVLRLHSMGVYIRVLSSSTTMGKAQLMDAGIYIESRRYKSKIAPGFGASWWDSVPRSKEFSAAAGEILAGAGSEWAMPTTKSAARSFRRAD